jgi:hypothetical protein
VVEELLQWRKHKKTEDIAGQGRREGAGGRKIRREGGSLEGWLLFLMQ